MTAMSQISNKAILCFVFSREMVFFGQTGNPSYFVPWSYKRCGVKVISLLVNLS